MAWVCGNCGAETCRGGVTFDDKGSAVRERCSHCAPEEFDSAFRMPSDNRVYAGPQAMPHMYTRDKDDVYHAKDELIADTIALWDEGPTERARRHKRQTRRTEPLTPEELEKTKLWAERVLAPIVRNGTRADVIATLNPK